MALKDLSLGAMVSISAPWMDPAVDRPTLEGYPELAGSVLTMERAHDGLLGTQAHAGLNAELVEELSEEIRALDATHDRKARASFLMVEGLIERADVPAERDRWVEVREVLFPTGLQPNTSSYLSEAGNVELTRARITPRIQQRLDNTLIDGQPLSRTIHAWFRAGEALGEAFTRRARLQNESDAQMVSAGEVLDARNYWIRATNSFIQMLGLVDVDPDVQKHLLTPLRDAEKAALRSKPAPEEAAPEEAANAAKEEPV